MKKKLKEVIEKIHKGLTLHGGGIELVDVNDGVVKVRLTGACAGCPISQMTMKSYVEKAIKDELPEIKEVQAVQ